MGGLRGLSLIFFFYFLLFFISNKKTIKNGIRIVTLWGQKSEENLSEETFPDFWILGVFFYFRKSFLFSWKDFWNQNGHIRGVRKLTKFDQRTLSLILGFWGLFGLGGLIFVFYFWGSFYMLDLLQNCYILGGQKAK